MKSFILIIWILQSVRVFASDCILPPNGVKNMATYLVDTAEVVFYGYPKSIATEVTDDLGKICLTWKVEYISTEKIKGDETMILSVSKPLCIAPSKNRSEVQSTTLIEKTSFEKSLLVFDKTETDYELNSCLIKIYKEMGDKEFRRQLDTTSD